MTFLQLLMLLIAEALAQKTWTCPLTGAIFRLEELEALSFSLPMTNLRGATFALSVGNTVTCGNAPGAISACISTPGVPPQAAGLQTSRSVELLDRGSAMAGIRLAYDGGELCDITKRPRKTVLEIVCNPLHDNPAQTFSVVEGTGNSVCVYSVRGSHNLGCPVGYTGPTAATAHGPPPTTPEGATLPGPRLASVSGCRDSTPPHTTTECPPTGGKRLVLLGTNLPRAVAAITVEVGGQPCANARLDSVWQISCDLPAGSGLGLNMEVRFTLPSGEQSTLVLADALSYKTPPNFKASFRSFQELGVGGLDNEINEIYRRVFQSRSLPARIVQGLGITHTKGILLYGPPGSGKTLVARTISKIVGTNKVTLINTPDIMQKFLGESEKQLRAHFQPALDEWKKEGENSDLFILIFDEIDSIFRERGRGDGSAASVAYDSIVNTLLTLMDGLQETNNIVVFGMTNRKELIDTALLRPGRFEVQIEIGLPSEEGRKAIFDIHTRDMRSSGLLGASVDTTALAKSTPRFSGAEIAGIVRNAASLAVERFYRAEENIGQQTSVDNMVVEMADFVQAIEALEPAYGTSHDTLLQRYLPLGLIQCGYEQQKVLAATSRLLLQFRAETSGTKSASRAPHILFHGPAGTGKTALAVHLALNSDFEFVRVIDPSSMLHLPLDRRIARLIEEFQNGYKAKSGLLVLDNIETLVGMVLSAQQTALSHDMAHAFMALLQATPPARSKLIVLATTSLDITSAAAAALRLSELFPVKQRVPFIGAGAAQNVMSELHVHRDGRVPFSFPSGFSISMRNLLHVVRAIQFEGQKDTPEGDDVTVSQSALEQALRLFGDGPGSTDGFFAAESEDEIDPYASLNVPMIFSDGRN
eukprot:m.250476 g.250476  ORF g.250476 m.250476 type:complete len:873 (+) comp22641_c1_seq2:58-2676(+)